jgi:hypothetical protein
VLAVQKDATTFLLDPLAGLGSSIPSERDAASRFKEFKENFKISDYSGKIARMLNDSGDLRKLMDRIGM